MNTTQNTETVFSVSGDKVGTVVQEGADWVAYNLSDFEVYRGEHYTSACEALWAA